MEEREQLPMFDVTETPDGVVSIVPSSQQPLALHQLKFNLEDDDSKFKPQTKEVPEIDLKKRAGADYD